MTPLRVLPLSIHGVVVVCPDIYRDFRGEFVETYRADRYSDLYGFPLFVQDNYSRSSKHTLRGLHAQLRRPQAKLVRAVSGAIFDVAVDIRVGSPTFGKWCSTVLDSVYHRQMFVPAGFAHGFEVLSEYAEVEYKCSNLYCPGDEITIRYSDPAIGIQWPMDAPTLSNRDAEAPSLAEVQPLLPRYPYAWCP